MHKAVFLDRDGTINEEIHFCSDPKDFRLLPGAAEGISLLNQAGYKVVVITNQSGIGRGFFSEKTLKDIHEKMVDQLAREGAKLDAIYYCPHGPDEGCACRKPSPGLVFKAAREMGIKLGKSYFIGDRPVDVETGRKAGCPSILIGMRKAKTTPLVDFSCGTLKEAAYYILERDGVI